METSLSFSEILKLGLLSQARDAAARQGRNLTTPELEIVLAHAVLQSNFADADEISKRLGRSLTVDELTVMHKVRLACGSYDLASLSAKRLGRALTSAECDKIFIDGLNRRQDVGQLITMIERNLISHEAMQLAIEYCIEHALPNTANFVAKRLNRKFTAHEKQRAIASCIRLDFKDRVSDARSLPIAA